MNRIQYTLFGLSIAALFSINPVTAMEKPVATITARVDAIIVRDFNPRADKEQINELMKKHWFDVTGGLGNYNQATTDELFSDFVGGAPIDYYRERKILKINGKIEGFITYYIRTTKPPYTGKGPCSGETSHIEISILPKPHGHLLSEIAENDLRAKGSTLVDIIEKDNNKEAVKAAEQAGFKMIRYWGNRVKFQEMFKQLNPPSLKTLTAIATAKHLKDRNNLKFINFPAHITPEQRSAIPATIGRYLNE